MLPLPYRQLRNELAVFLPAERLVDDPLRLLAWGTDASFYRLVPKLVVVVDDEDELRRVLACCARLGTPVTFRAAGTSLSGQAVTDSVLVMLGDGWRGVRVADDARTIALQPGVIGAVGTLFGEAQVNIADMVISREVQPDGTAHALMVIKVDSAPSQALLDKLKARQGILRVKQVELPKRA